MTKVPTCPSCGADLLIGAAALADASDLDQTLADRDQTSSDSDQTSSDHDQGSSDLDQRAADDDQAAANRDFAAGGDPRAHERSARARAQSEVDRTKGSGDRDQTAGDRMEAADARDRAAELRDHSAASRDALASLHDEDDAADSSRDEILLRIERDRARAAADRAKAADDRVRAAVEREQAAADREEALQIRARAKEAVELATTDELTGVRTRRFGLEEMSRELERAARTGEPLIVVFVDVNGLKKVNDEQGHLAGDDLLRTTAQTVRTHVRSYDLLVRFGGDEFVCAMPNVTAAIARSRFDQIAAALMARDAEHSITYGIAEAKPSEELTGVIARADEDLLAGRGKTISQPSFPRG